MTTENKNIDFASMSDEDFENFNPSSLEGDEPEQDSGKLSAAATEDSDNASDDTGGADAEGSPDTDERSSADSTSDDADDDAGAGQQAADDEHGSDESHQDSLENDDQSVVTADKSGTTDTKSDLSRLMAPFKAAKRTIQVKSVEDARRLMQMGVDYSRKMADMKPYQRVLKTLEKNDLLDEESINFMISLQKKDPAAIKKFFKDSEIDPHDLAYEEDTDYRPTDHMIPEKELALDNVLDDIRSTDAFQKTAKIITDEWDTDSKRVLLDNPQAIRVINDHVANGIYDRIAEQVATERTFGRLDGLSDLQAYKKVGDAMNEAGEFGPPPPAPSQSGVAQRSAQDSGSYSADNADNLRNRKRAASPTRGRPSAGKPKIDFSQMSDDEIEKFNVNSL